jgi:hypothetical protein
MNNFQPLSIADLTSILGLTIKKDEDNKILTFLCELSAFTEDAQFNISYNAPSSTGKSYIPTEIANLFPREDVIEIGYCSPTAFFHDVGEYDKEKQGYIVDLSRKILIFLDQPHMQLLERLRPLLSHDKKEIRLKITDKNQKHGLRTKNVIMIGYPSVIFCSAGLQLDEQETTRLFLLSPEVNQEKIKEAITQKVRKESDSAKFRAWLKELPERKLLKERVAAIKQEMIAEIRIPNPEILSERFLNQNKMLKPRHQRDVGRLLSLVKSLALLNLWWREREGASIMATQEDIDGAFTIWEKVAITQELNLPPYVYRLLQEVIMPLWDSKPISAVLNEKEGLSRQEVLQRHYEVYGRMLDIGKFVKEILPMLETAGLITQEQHPTDKRKLLIYPMVADKNWQTRNNNGGEGGVNLKAPELFGGLESNNSTDEIIISA